MTVREATSTDIQNLMPLVDGYYDVSPVPHTADHEGVMAHVRTLIEPGNPVGGLLVATKGETIVGFAFLYYGFNKRALQRTVTLNDLFVDADFRRQGFARELLTATFSWARKHDAISVDWVTRTSNTGAQTLYDQVGERETGWIHYGHQL